jgi:hypothetical protein
VSGFRPINAPGDACSIFVTGPYSIAIVFYTGGTASTTPLPNGPQFFSGSEELSLVSAGFPYGWAAAVVYGTWTLPYEYTAAVANQLGSSALWVNFPYLATDALVSSIATRMAAQIGPNNTIYLQYNNENWNSAFHGYTWFVGAATLVGFNTSGTIMGLAPAPMEPLAYGSSSFCALTGFHLFNVFEDAWVAAGRASSQIKRVEGSWWAGSGYGATTTTGPLLASDQQFGSQPDVVCVAPYLSVPEDASIVIACSPAGSPVGNAGSWPADAINDFGRWYFAVSQGNLYNWQAQAETCNAFGQPVRALSAQTVEPGSGGTFAVGEYYLYNTFVDSSGNETTVGLSQSSQFSLGTVGNQIKFEMPPWPSWAQAMNVYVSAPNGAAGAPPLLCQTFTRQDSDSGNEYDGYAGGATVTLTTAPATGAANPPTTNKAATPNNVRIPRLVCYEGNLVSIPTANPGATSLTCVPLGTAIAHDLFYHPSGRDLTWGWYAIVQQGCPTVANGGCVAANYYMLYAPPSYTSGWSMAYGQNVMPGSGASNQYATIQGGYPADYHDHSQINQPVQVQGMIDFASVSSPVPVQPTPVANRRRWYIGLSRCAARARLGR